MERTAIILSGGLSSRLGQEKGLLLLEKKPLIEHVLDAIDDAVDERIVVVASHTQADNYKKALGTDVSVVIDKFNAQSPLIGTLSGLEKARGNYSLLLPCDNPLVSREILALLLDLCVGRAAAVPRWPHGYIEPLQAAYHTETAAKAAENALMEGGQRMQSMIDRLVGVRYVSTLVLQQLDPELLTFFNINTPLDLKRAQIILRRRQRA